MSKMFKTTVNILNKVARQASFGINIIGIYFILMMMFLATSDVIMRYFFNMPIRGSYEAVELMLGIAVVLSLAHIGYTNGHIKVDFLTNKFPQNVKAILDSLILFLSPYFAGP